MPLALRNVSALLLGVCGSTYAATTQNAALSCGKWSGGEGPHSAWVYPDQQGILTYRPLDSRGDRIMDFSYAGYMGGGVALPNVATVETIEATGTADDTAAIQSAIDKVSRMPLVNGYRGAILLRPGTYQLGGTLKIQASGVVLRGSGAGDHGTLLKAAGGSHTLVVVGGAGKITTDPSSATTITDAYVPSGTKAVTVADAAKFKVGDDVVVSRPVTAKWIQAMGMDTLVRNGQPQTWLRPGQAQLWQRRITAIDGKTLVLDIPLSDSLDSAYTGAGAAVARYSSPGLIQQVGIEHLRFEGAPRITTLGAGIEHQAVTFGNTMDAWVDDVEGHNMIGGVSVQQGARRITINAVVLRHDHNQNLSTGAKAFDFSIGGSQVFVNRSASIGSRGSFYIVTHSLSGGPNVALNFQGKAEDAASLQPHQRWATGLLIDNAEVRGGIDFVNRLTAGSGHGWSMGWGVVWNSAADTLLLQQPPGGTNWSIGNIGQPARQAHPLPLGVVEAKNVHVTPSSLYLAQLCERLGPQAVTNIGYR